MRVLPAEYSHFVTRLDEQEESEKSKAIVFGG